MLAPPLSPDPVVIDWIDRHRRPANFLMHLLSIPPTILGVLYIPVYVVLLSLPVFLLSVMLFFGGYLVQFLGHVLDWSEPGELAILRRWWQGRSERLRAEGRRAPGAES